MARASASAPRARAFGGWVDVAFASLGQAASASGFGIVVASLAVATEANTGSKTLGTLSLAFEFLARSVVGVPAGSVLVDGVVEVRDLAAGRAVLLAGLSTLGAAARPRCSSTSSTRIPPDPMTSASPNCGSRLIPTINSATGCGAILSTRN